MDYLVLFVFWLKYIFCSHRRKTMGIGRDSRHKHRKTGGRVNVHQKKRKFEIGRPSAMTRMGAKRVRTVRTRGGNRKFRALRLDHGNFSWGSENCTRKVRIVDVVYNASNNELVRTKTLVKNAIVQVDAHPFKQWYQKHYRIELGKKDKKKKDDPVTGCKSTLRKIKERQQNRKIAQSLDDQFTSGRMLAAIASRPGQSGRCDGYLLEGAELDFYVKKLQTKKKHQV
eukprot:GEMP01033343.1.p2 GENE.GEMP01033343.1~~GEMP01033343.1.p2  ORF type:complete len:227 (+),score=49.35 GEMP01033343.1:1061-1741(+)